MGTGDIACSERKRGRPSDKDRAAIDARVIEAGFSVFREVGFEHARMERIASEAGITKMSLYRRFPNKGELLAEVIRALPIPDPPENAAGGALAAIRVLMWTYRKWIGEERLLVTQRLALATLHVERPVREALAALNRRYVEPVDVLVDAAKADGLLPPMDTSELREILFDLLVNDAASLPLHGYPTPDDQRRVFAMRWAVVERGLLIA